jgi:hypothetical protein
MVRGIFIEPSRRGHGFAGAQTARPPCSPAGFLRAVPEMRGRGVPCPLVSEARQACDRDFWGQ